MTLSISFVLNSWPQLLKTSLPNSCYIFSWLEGKGTWKKEISRHTYWQGTNKSNMNSLEFWTEGSTSCSSVRSRKISTSFWYLLVNKRGRKGRKGVHVKKERQRKLFKMLWNLTDDFSVSEAQQYGLLCQEREKEQGNVSKPSHEGQHRESAHTAPWAQLSPLWDPFPALSCSTSGALSPQGHWALLCTSKVHVFMFSPCFV